MSNQNKSKVIAALDVPLKESEKLIEELAPHVGGFKVGYRQIAAGNATRLLKKIEKVGSRAFYDGKFKDIPKTVADAVREIEKLGVWMFNVHCDGGIEMMEAALDARKTNPSPLVLGVTLLTSLSFENLVQMGALPKIPAGLEKHMAEAYKNLQVAAYVLRLAKLAQEVGLNGVVASPHETKSINTMCGEGFSIVTPAVRPTGAKADDQKRVGTARQAILDGSSYLVVGRPIYEAANPLSAVLALNTEVEQALMEKQKGTTV